MTTKFAQTSVALGVETRYAELRKCDQSSLKWRNGLPRVLGFGDGRMPRFRKDNFCGWSPYIVAVEIERKFLVCSNDWRGLTSRSILIRQGYVAHRNDCSVRVRLKGDQYLLTIKGGDTPLSRQEFEYPIPAEDGKEILENLCQHPLIEKCRHIVSWHDGLFWEIDEFQGHLAGIIVAEIELPTPDCPFDRPQWLGAEVTDDATYLNVNLGRSPSQMCVAGQR